MARAVKAGGGVRVLDCTAGLARDAFVLASLGCEVTLVERSRVVYTFASGWIEAGKEGFRNFLLLPIESN